MDSVLIVTAADGTVTVHRDNCKRVEERTDTLSAGEVLDSNPGSLTTAKKASCCKPTDAVMSEIEQAGWDALEAQANAAASDDNEETSVDEDLIGSTDETAGDEDLIGEAPAPAAEKPKGKTAAKVAGAKAEAKEIDGLAALKKVAKHLGIKLGKDPVFPGFGKAFKTEAKQSVYINSKGNADVRAVDADQAKAFAAKPHVERRSGNYVRIDLAAL